MLTPTQENYLSRLPDEVLSKPVEVFPWDKKGLVIAEKVVDKIKSTIPEYKVIFIGSMALHIAGQKDIDLSVLSSASDFPEHQQNLEKMFGKPDKLGQTSIGWHFERDGYEIGIYLTDPKTSMIQEQIDIFNILKNNTKLLKEYEAIKLSMNGKTYKEYQIAKYEFYNRALGIS